ncbi:MAG TPA: hypothetical protein VEV84_04410 [Pyrinomonadaceae bacterium]|jgi:hypothetical protein|nr:hypothetical protein [Pyrinomonadaceae bacterium]
MTFKRLLSLGTFVGCVLFLYTIAGAQTTTTTAQPTVTSTNPRVVITDNLSKPTTASPTAAQPKTTTTTFGNHSVSVTDNVTALPIQDTTNGKFFNVTTWDGSKWVTTRKWMPNPTKPNP